MRIHRWAATVAPLAILALSPAVLNAASSEPLFATDTPGIVAAKGERRVIYGRIEDVIWSDGGRKKPPGSAVTLFNVSLSGTDDFGLVVYNHAYAAPTPRLDADAQELIGKLIRVESFIVARSPNDNSPYTPDWYMLIRNGYEFAIISEADWPADVPMSPDTSNVEERFQDDVEGVKDQLEVLQGELIDVQIAKAKIYAGEENWPANRDLCFKNYQGYEEYRQLSASGSRTQIIGQEDWLREGRRYSGTFAEFVEYYTWRLRHDGDNADHKDHHCGHYFAAELRTNPQALTYALAAFAAHHNVNVDDDKSAEMMANIYATGRGGRKDSDQAEAWSEKATVRRAKLAGQVGQPVETTQLRLTVVAYGVVPEDFVPQMPTLPANKTLIVSMDKMEPHSLIRIKIGRFSRAYLLKSGVDFLADPQAQRLIAEDMQAVTQSRPLVIECTYWSDEFKTDKFYRYWYQSRPAAADPATLSARVSNHPLLYIRAPLDRCPGSGEEAMNHR